MGGAGLRACFGGGAVAMETGAAVADRAATMTSFANAETQSRPPAGPCFFDA